jgi:hypothetical protein
LNISGEVEANGFLAIFEHLGNQWDRFISRKRKGKKETTRWLIATWYMHKRVAELSL